MAQTTRSIMADDSRPRQDQRDLAGRNPAPLRARTVATALIMGSIIGVGIFNLPTSLAVYGPISLVSMGLTTVGALALALLFAALSRRLPADGGPYAYARVGVRQPARLRQRLVVLDHRVGRQRRHRGRLGAVRRGVRQQGPQQARLGAARARRAVDPGRRSTCPASRTWASVQVVTTILKFAALAFMSTVGLFYIQRANFTPWNVSGESAIGAIGGGMAIALFSYLGVEVAAVAAGEGARPRPQHPAGRRSSARSPPRSSTCSR